jgi:hypothetical protein
VKFLSRAPAKSLARFDKLQKIIAASVVAAIEKDGVTCESLLMLFLYAHERRGSKSNAAITKIAFMTSSGN